MHSRYVNYGYMAYVIATTFLSCSIIRWKGSVYKLVWFDFVIYLGFYFVISLLYRFGLNQEQMRQLLFFHSFVRYGTMNW